MPHARSVPRSRPNEKGERPTYGMDKDVNLINILTAEMLRYFLFSAYIICAFSQQAFVQKAKYEHEYGEVTNVRPAEKIIYPDSSSCSIRVSDKKLVCPPDVMYIGASKSGAKSIEYYLKSHPMIKNIMSPQVIEKKKTFESHIWEKPTKLELTLDDSANETVWIKERVEMIQDSQEGFDSANNRPILIEYTLNYFVLDYLPQILSNAFGANHKMKFIVCLREPAARSISIN